MCRTKAIFVFTALLIGLLVSHACASIPLKIPLIEDVKVDGNPSDWGAAGFSINLFADSAGSPSTSLNAKDTVRLAWDSRGLLVLFQVSDTTPHENPNLNSLWNGTSVELIMADRVGGSNGCHLLISPGLSPEQPNIRSFFYDNRNDMTLKGIPLTQFSARTVIGTGYILEVLFPWENLGIKSKVGAQFALQVMINHVNAAGKGNTLMWYPRPGADEDTTLMCPILLSKEAGQDKSFVAFAEEGSVWPEKIIVVGDARLAGRKVTAAFGSRILAESKMESASGRSVARLSLPIKQGSLEEKNLSIAVEGETYLQAAPAKPVALTTPTTLASVFGRSQGVLGSSSLVFSPFVFSGTAFPDCDFHNAAQIKKLVGDYTINCRFFNAKYEEVTQADKFGRYGAVVSITAPESGTSAEQYITLFRQKDPIDWNNTQLWGMLQLPEGMGLDAGIYKKQSKSVNDLLKRALLDRLLKEPDGAIVMAGLLETSERAAQTTSRNSVWTLDDNWWYGLLKKLNKDKQYHYSAYLPKRYSEESEKSWPLLIVLHGSGERDLTDENLQKNPSFIPVIEYTKDKYPMITVIPHCPIGQYWNGIIIKDLVDSLSRKYRIDRKHIYLTGYSMGGYGTFYTAAEYPDIFAAIAPICGGGDLDEASRFLHMGVWAFHGDKDPAVPVQESVQMINAIQKAGGEAKLTIYPGVGHNSWDATFKNPALYEWLLKHSK